MGMKIFEQGEKKFIAGTGVVTLLRKSDGPKYRSSHNLVGTGVLDGPKCKWKIRSFLFENNTFISCTNKKRTKEIAEEEYLRSRSINRNSLIRFLPRHFVDKGVIEQCSAVRSVNICV